MVLQVSRNRVVQRRLRLAVARAGAATPAARLPVSSAHNAFISSLRGSLSSSASASLCCCSARSASARILLDRTSWRACSISSEIAADDRAAVILQGHLWRPFPHLRLLTAYLR